MNTLMSGMGVPVQGTPISPLIVDKMIRQIKIFIAFYLEIM